MNNILPLDFNIEEIKYKTNSIGKGFMKDSSYEIEYYWNDLKNGLYRYIKCNSYADAAFNRTPVVETFKQEIKSNFVIKNYDKTVLKYNPISPNIYILYEKKINTAYDFDNKCKKTKISNKKHRVNKKNKVIKYHKVINEEILYSYNFYQYFDEIEESYLDDERENRMWNRMWNIQYYSSDSDDSTNYFSAYKHYNRF